MVWKIDARQGDESAKVRLDVLHYMNGRCLDLGCGPAKVWPHFIGVDNCIDTQLFGIRIQPDVKCETVERLEMFGDASWDCVFSSHTLEHITDYRRALREFWRLVRPGGTLILYLPHRDFYPCIGQPGANPDHKHDFAPEDIIIAMRDQRPGAAHWDLEVNEERNGGVEYSFLQVYRKTGQLRNTESWQNPKPEKTCAVLRLGAYGDALIGASILPALKREGYHITMYVERPGLEMLRHDPHVDVIKQQPKGVLDGPMQIAWWLHEQRKYDRFINLCGSIERRYLPQPSDQDFYLPYEQRARVLNKNYLESVHEYAGVPFDPQHLQQRFYASAPEMVWAAKERAKFDGPVVVLNFTGSSLPKWWPHGQQLIDLLAKQRVHVVVVGDLHGMQLTMPEGFGKLVGIDWQVRNALAFAQLADVVIGQESVVVNAVAFEPMLKIVLLSHSTHENLTRDWTNTLAVQAEGLPCWPCHRIHHEWTHCNRDADSGAAMCQQLIDPARLAEEVHKYLAWQAEQVQQAIAADGEPLELEAA